MAAAPKLTPGQWADARQRWEEDPRDGFAWLVKEMGLSVSKQGVADRAKREGWEKEAPSADRVASKRAEKAPDRKLANLAGDKQKGKAGRPSAYRQEYAEQAYRLCLMGLTDAQLADFFEVSEQIINAWKKAHPEFLESLKKGKAVADARVAEALLRAALGYSHPHEDIRVVDGQIVITPTTKYFPPDTTAAIFWLENRQPTLWRDKTETDITVDAVDRTELRDRFERLMGEARKRQERVLRERGLLNEDE